MPMLVVELEALFKSNTEGIAGEEYAVVEAPPSNAVKSSSRRGLWGRLVSARSLGARQQDGYYRRGQRGEHYLGDSFCLAV